MSTYTSQFTFDPAKPLTIVHFECGCIGTEPCDGKSAILSACDSDDGGPGGIAREVSTTKYTPVGAGYGTLIWQAFADAHKLQVLRAALRDVAKE